MTEVHRLPLMKLADLLPMEPDPGALLQVGDLAREAGKTVRALHLYEELGLLKPHARSKGRFRLYGRDALVRVRWIGKLQETGLSLAEIAELVRGWESAATAPHAMNRVRRAFETRLQQTREQIARLSALEAELEASLDYLEVCDVCDPVRVVSQCAECDLHECNQTAPDLVRGVQASG
jgi:MerR family copper efflux transcriptional regulator